MITVFDDHRNGKYIFRMDEHIMIVPLTKFVLYDSVRTLSNALFAAMHRTDDPFYHKCEKTPALWSTFHRLAALLDSLGRQADTRHPLRHLTLNIMEASILA